jgi:hypothetical protein
VSACAALETRRALESALVRTHKTLSAPSGAEIATLRVLREKFKTCQKKFLR